MKNKAEARLFDLSEKHLAWFTYTPLAENNEEYPSQGGEGLHVVVPDDASPNTISNKTYNIGGLYNYATTAFSAGMGPALEKAVPYQKTTEDEYKLINFIAVEIDADGYYNMDNTVARVYDPDAVSMDDIREKWTALGFTEPEELLTAILYS